MKAFNLLRYLRQYSILILLVTLAGAFGVYSFGSSRQTYKASVVIQYTNDGAASGYTPNGEPIDVKEIYCAEVITRAIENLGLSDMPDSLRSRCYVKEVIPSDQQTINEVLLEKGEAPDYFADTYTVFFVADHTKSAEYARDVLDAVISSYFEYYSEKYIEQQLLPNGTSDLEGKDYDFIETVKVLENVTLEMVNYLQNRKELYPDFRASSTGYSFTDLYGVYHYYYSYEIPRLYAMILTRAQSKDVEVLVKRLNNAIETYERSIANKESQLASLTTLMDNFTTRSRDMMDYHYHSTSGSGQTEYILKDVENQRDAVSQETTYDDLLQQYVQLKTQCEYDRIDLEHSRYLLGVFSELLNTENTGEESGENIQAAVDRYVEGLNRYYDLVDSTAREHNGVLSARNLQTLSTVKVSTSVNVKLYMMLSVVLFLVLGCGGAIVLGRGTDFMEYLVYVDKRVGLPNRARCDLYIEEHSETLLAEHFTCMFVALDSLYSHTTSHGRTIGDEMMKDFAAILSSLGKAYGFVGYNDAGQFMAFFPDCPGDKARAIAAVLEQQVEEYNVAHPDRVLQYSCGIANSTEDGEYQIRGLLRLAIARIGKARKETKA